MTQPLSIEAALVHHQAGRLPEAEVIYRQLLALNPNDGDALHWLGLLAHQCGKPAIALGMIGKAIQFRGDVASYHHNFAEAWLSVGEIDQAIASYRAALALKSDAAPTHGSLAMALFRRGLYHEAIEHFSRATALGVSHPQVHHHFGIALLRSRRFEEAVAQLERALALDPELADALHHLGEAAGNLGRLDEAIVCFEKALAIKPDFERPYHGIGVARARQGRLTKAIEAFKMALRLRSEYPEAEQGLAAVYHAAGRYEESLPHYRRAIELRPEYLEARLGLSVAAERANRVEEAIEQIRAILRIQPNLPDIEYHLAALSGENVPKASPLRYITACFDSYAETFDQHLTEVLAYRAPEILLDKLRQVELRDDLEIVDLGCGTGLCGRLLRPFARRLVGVDLSSGMIEKARQRGIYDELMTAEIAEFLQGCDAAFDLAVAADVLVYVGDLAPVFSGAAKALRPGGLLAFSVEARSGDGFGLDRTRRYSHSAAYLAEQAAKFGFVERVLQTDVVRTERNQEVPGYFAVYQFAGSENHP